MQRPFLLLSYCATDFCMNETLFRNSNQDKISKLKVNDALLMHPSTNFHFHIIG